MAECVLVILHAADAAAGGPWSWEGWPAGSTAVCRIGAGGVSDIQLQGLANLQGKELELAFLPDGTVCLLHLNPHHPCKLDGQEVHQTTLSWGEHQLELGGHAFRLRVGKVDKDPPDLFASLSTPGAGPGPGAGGPGTGGPGAGGPGAGGPPPGGLMPPPPPPSS